MGTAWLVLAGAVLWGTTGTAQALAPQAATPLAVGTVRLVLGAALLVLWALAARSRTRPAGVPRPRVPALPALAGAVGVAAYQLTFFAAVDVAGVALGTAVAIGSSPIVTGLIEWVLERRAPGVRWWAATAVAAAGVAVLAGPSRMVVGGVLLALAAGASYATYAIASKRLLDAGLDGPTAMAAVFGGGGLLLAPLLVPLAVRSELGWVATPRGGAVVLWLSGATILVAYLLFARGLAGVAASTAATLSLAEPLTAALLGLVVLGERPTPLGLLGAAVIVLALLVLVLQPAPRRAVGA
jgi:DME family drug/metabolite transporter